MICKTASSIRRGAKKNIIVHFPLFGKCVCVPPIYFVNLLHAGSQLSLYGRLRQKNMSNQKQSKEMMLIVGGGYVHEKGKPLPFWLGVLPNNTIKVCAADWSFAQLEVMLNIDKLGMLIVLCNLEGDDDDGFNGLYTVVALPCESASSKYFVLSESHIPVEMNPSAITLNITGGAYVGRYLMTDLDFKSEVVRESDQQ